MYHQRNNLKTPLPGKILANTFGINTMTKMRRFQDYMKHSKTSIQVWNLTATYNTTCNLEIKKNVCKMQGQTTEVVESFTYLGNLLKKYSSVSIKGKASWNQIWTCKLVVED